MTDLDAERAHLDASRTALTRMRDQAEQLHRTGATVAGDAFSSESLGTALRRRVAELTIDPGTPLFFGRLTLTPEAPPTSRPAEIFYVGRRHIMDEAGDPMVLDWRAELPRAFYQASVRDPRGVAVRRRFGFSAGTLTGFEDEHLTKGEELGTTSGILLAEIERPRVGPMRDIVATIQPDQDDLVRAELAESICVQGAPGTGKTAVGLHRAAYLLYAHRERLQRSGVLVIGPNRAFLSYIAGVLPALGEIEVTQVSVEELYAGRVPVRGSDPAAVHELKHDPRLATVLANALAQGLRKPIEPLVVTDGSWRWRVAVEALMRVVDDARREHLPYAVGRERVLARTVGLLQRQAEARRGESPADAWLKRMARSAEVRAFLDHAWPAVTAEGLVFALLSSPLMLASAAAGVLSAEEQTLLCWDRPPRTVKTARWSPADTLLIDEAAGLLDRLPSLGHIVIDEAQDLSPMQCRAVARRSEHGSVTLLGDLAQATAPWAVSSWSTLLNHLGKDDARVVPLTTGFRVPGAVVELANRLLPALAVDVPPGVSLRRDGSLTISRVAALSESTVEAVTAALAFEGSIAVIGTESFLATLPAFDERVSVVPASLAKGLEFDHVIVVEPAAIVAAEPRGLHRLYVVLTRAVSRLVVLHADPLPAPLTPPPLP